jgi:type IV pilus assembly protein PilB
MDVSPKLLLERLVRNSAITQEESQKYELESLKRNGTLFDYLIKETNIKRYEIIKAIAQISGITSVDLSNSPTDPQAVSLISESISRKFSVVPYKYDPAEQKIYVATSDPFNTATADFL